VETVPGDWPLKNHFEFIKEPL